jgi:hypothetical protein
MPKSIVTSTAAIALAAAACALLPMRSHDAVAQSAPYLVNVVNLDIMPEQFDRFMQAAKENGAASTTIPDVASLTSSWHRTIRIT